LLVAADWAARKHSATAVRPGRAAGAAGGRGRRACHLLTGPRSACGADSPAFACEQVRAVGLPVPRVWRKLGSHPILAKRPLAARKRGRRSIAPHAVARTRRRRKAGVSDRPSRRPAGRRSRGPRCWRVAGEVRSEPKHLSAHQSGSGDQCRGDGLTVPAAAQEQGDWTHLQLLWAPVRRLAPQVATSRIKPRGSLSLALLLARYCDAASVAAGPQPREFVARRRRPRRVRQCSLCHRPTLRRRKQSSTAFTCSGTTSGLKCPEPIVLAIISPRHSLTAPARSAFGVPASM
jgi:hypothetical protein